MCKTSIPYVYLCIEKILVLCLCFIDNNNKHTDASLLVLSYCNYFHRLLKKKSGNRHLLKIIR